MSFCRLEDGAIHRPEGQKGPSLTGSYISLHKNYKKMKSDKGKGAATEGQEEQAEPSDAAKKTTNNKQLPGRHSSLKKIFDHLN